ncbi:hypothetical protein ACT02A_04870 [Klebsiella quasipneumoniae]|uniref:hypothetical protein n=1 Tax=Klebsiella quasipneumoniae TaxID=1463165 RepID=UPI00402B90F8
MTSKLTREKAQWLHDACEEAATAGIKLTMNPNELLMFTSYALAAMDSEPAAPVAEIVSIYGDPEAFGEREIRPLVGIQQMPYGTKLYRHAQPAPVVPEEVTDEDCPALVKYDVTEVDEAWARGFNACRSAMLQELKKSAGTEATCRSNENAQVLTSINPAPDLVSLPKNAKSLTGNSPVIPDGYVMVPKEPTESMVIAGFESEPDEFFSESEVWEAYQKMSGCEQAAFRARLCWTAMLAAAPQEVKGE